jgi:hypothetical protein
LGVVEWDVHLSAAAAPSYRGRFRGLTPEERASHILAGSGRFLAEWREYHRSGRASTLDTRVLRPNLEELYGFGDWTRLAAGWPSIAFEGVYVPVHNRARPRGRQPVRLQGLLNVDTSVGQVRLRGIVPFRPVWSGLLLNLFVYFVIALTLLRGPRTILVRRRLRKGLCPQCAYPIGVSPVCTECGTALPLRRESPVSEAAITAQTGSDPHP